MGRPSETLCLTSAHQRKIEEVGGNGAAIFKRETWDTPG